jgi:hypothetical protein
MRCPTWDMRASLAAASAPRAPPCAMDPTADARAVGTRHSHLNVVVLGRAHVSHPHLLSSLIKTSTCPKLSVPPPKKMPVCRRTSSSHVPLGTVCFFVLCNYAPFKASLSLHGQSPAGPNETGGKAHPPKTKDADLIPQTLPSNFLVS